MLPERDEPDLHYDYEPGFSHSTVQKAKETLRSIAENRNALIVTGIVNLFYYASGIIEEDGLKESGQGDGINSRQKREIRAKRNAQNLGPQM